MVTSDGSGLEFDWDASKELANVKKHRVTFLEAVESFFDPKGIQLTDVEHSKQENRFYWIGKSNSSRVLTTWFTRRNSVIRIIGSAEWRKFKRLYNESTQNK